MDERATVDHSSLYGHAIADKIEAQPELLEIPLANIERWLAQNHSSPHRLEQWRGIIIEAKASKEGLTRLLFVLRDRGEESMHLRSFSPFAGILTPQERRVIIKQCAWSH
jgi:hypothetical protein